uniref:Uncharacterized protein n=1 Tax=Ditylenchus dipsaci TaxID=166011 RepID=A0A915E8Z0_9BILA
METDALDELVLPIYSSNLTFNGSLLAVTINPLILATSAGEEADDVEHGVMKVPLVKVFFLLAYILVFFLVLLEIP